MSMTDYHRKQLTRIALLLALFIASAKAVAAEEDATGDDAQHTYAVLLSGGRSMLSNHERYWNDCSLMFRMLSERYHIPKRNIMALIADGTDPAPDMIRENGQGFMSSPSDLDGDGYSDNVRAATIGNLNNLMIDLAMRLSEDDHLFFFIVDHGNLDEDEQEGYISMWNNERLSDAALCRLMNMIHVGAISIVMGQCHGGFFAEKLKGNNRVIMTACDKGEVSWACPDRAYDEFIYHWCCAMRGVDDDGLAVSADTDNDGHTTMYEAFTYAKENDRRDETPQYISSPEELGRRLSFDNIPTDNDVGIRPIAPCEDLSRQLYTADGRPFGHHQQTPNSIYIERKQGRTKKILHLK